MIQLNILLLLVAFYKFLQRKKVKIRVFVQKWLDHMLLMRSYLVTMATECRYLRKKCLEDK